MDEFETYYEILGVEETAAEDNIRSAYRKLAKEYHPDTLPENIRRRPIGRYAEQRLREINEAHDVLVDRQKRSAYDAQLARYRAEEQMGSGRRARGDCARDACEPPAGSSGSGVEASASAAPTFSASPGASVRGGIHGGRPYASFGEALIAFCSDGVRNTLRTRLNTEDRVAIALSIGGLICFWGVAFVMDHPSQVERWISRAWSATDDPVFNAILNTVIVVGIIAGGLLALWGAWLTLWLILGLGVAAIVVSLAVVLPVVLVTSSPTGAIVGTGVIVAELACAWNWLRKRMVARGYLS
jgi:hypothetical protein